MIVQATGLSGFVGTNLKMYLVACNDIQIDDLNIRNQKPNDIKINANVVVHLAGKAHDLKKTSNADEYYQVNYELTKNLYDAFLKSNAEKFIFISSVKAAADQIDDILTEEIHPSPQTDYGKSKLMAEQYIQSQPLPAGKSYYILRPCMIHGQGNKGNLNLLYKFIEKGIPYPLASFQNKRSFLSVENLCFVIKELMEHNLPGGIYQVADDQALSTNELIQLISKISGKKSRLWHIPQALIKVLAKIGDLTRLPLNTERLQKLTESYVVDNSKIKSALNKSFPVTIEKGIELTVRSFKK